MEHTQGLYEGGWVIGCGLRQRAYLDFTYKTNPWSGQVHQTKLVSEWMQGRIADGKVLVLLFMVGHCGIIHISIRTQRASRISSLNSRKHQLSIDHHSWKCRLLRGSHSSQRKLQRLRVRCNFHGMMNPSKHYNADILT